MEKILGIAASVLFAFSGISCSQGGGAAAPAKAQGKPAAAQEILIDDFEFPVSGGLEGTIDFGAGNGSAVKVTASTDIKNTGSQSIKVEYDCVQDGFMYVARGFGLDARNAAWLVDTKDIDWRSAKALSFFMYGANSGAQLAVDIKDSGNELHRFMVKDDFSGWKEIVCPLAEFMPRGDWQPDNAEKNGVLDYPVKHYQFEPRTLGKGTWYFDTVKVKS